MPARDGLLSWNWLPRTAALLVCVTPLVPNARCAAQTPAKSVNLPPSCTADSLELSLHAYRAPGNMQVIALNYHNTGADPCTLREFRKQSGYPAYFPRGKPNPLTVLESDGWAHSSFRWHTEPTPAGHSCQDQTLRYILAGTPAGNLWLTSRTLLPRICSELEDDTDYHSGPFVADWPQMENAPNLSTPPAIDVAKLTYFENERVRFHLTLTDRAADDPSCPVILEVARNAQGEMRIDEVLNPAGPQLPANFRDSLRLPGAAYYWCHSMYPPPMPSNEYHFDVNLGTGAVWTGLGKHTFGFIQLAGFGDDGEYIQQPSDPITVDVVSAVDIPRNWGNAAKGVRVDLTLDKLTYKLGENVPLHLATEDVSAPFPIYDTPFVAGRGVAISGLELPPSLRVVVEDANGPMKPKQMIWEGSFRPLPCPKAYPTAVPVPEETQLSSLGLLPDRPGVYRIYATWSPYTSDATSCEPASGSKPYAPLVTVISTPLILRIVDKDAGPDNPMQ
jgi:hypothetical protein